MAKSNPKPTHHNFKDIEGQRFKMLVVLRFSHMHKRDGAFWICKCDCGLIKTVSRNALRNGQRTCGCEGRFFKHGKCNSAEYSVWENIIQRCTNPKAPSYRNYGGRGISVCLRWRSFENFCADMGPRPQPKLQIERIDNNGDYAPQNCRWATKRDQTRNTRRNHALSFRGKTMCLTDWAAEVRISAKTLSNRILSGWPTTRALTEPVSWPC